MSARPGQGTGIKGHTEDDSNVISSEDDTDEDQDLTAEMQRIPIGGQRTHMDDDSYNIPDYNEDQED